MNKEEQDLELEEMNREFQKELQALHMEETGGEQTHSHSGRRRKHKIKKKEKKKLSPFHIFIILLVILGILLAGAASAFFVLRMRGEKELQKSSTEEELTAPADAELEDEKYVVYKGQRYCYNENVINILFMGIDKSIQETGIDTIGENGQADALFIASIDKQTGHVSLVNISRDAMVDVNKYNVEGQYLGTEKLQVCLAYAYGDGREKSCLNTAASVSRLLYGIPIQAYAAIDYAAISILNDAVGGVTVEVLEDLPGAYPALYAGQTVTLSGEQAHSYVRSRDTAVLDSNNSRMNRQRQYLTSFISKALDETRADISLPITLYQAVSEYMVTDISSSEVTYLASMVLQKGLSTEDMKSVPGEVTQGEQYAEFIPDEDALFELILDVFYNKVS